MATMSRQVEREDVEVEDPTFDESYQFRMTSEQRRRWQRAAQRDHRRLSDWLRIVADREAARSEAEARGTA